MRDANLDELRIIYAVINEDNDNVVMMLLQLCRVRERESERERERERESLGFSERDSINRAAYSYDVMKMKRMRMHELSSEPSYWCEDEQDDRG